MIYLGIDPGLNGGIAFIDNGKLVLHKTPVIGGRDYDIQAMKDHLWFYKNVDADIFCIIENQISMPGQGLTSTLTTGKGFGIWLGLLAGLEIPFQVVSARQWQTKLFTGVNGKLNTKQKSEVIAKRLFPTSDFRKSERARVADDGLTDAACIAEYGRRISSGTSVETTTGIEHTPDEAVKVMCKVCGQYIPGNESNCVKN